MTDPHRVQRPAGLRSQLDATLTPWGAVRSGDQQEAPRSQRSLTGRRMPPSSSIQVSGSGAHGRVPRLVDPDGVCGCRRRAVVRHGCGGGVTAAALDVSSLNSIDCARAWRAAPPTGGQRLLAGRSTSGAGMLPPGRWAISVPGSGGAVVDVKLGGSPAMSRVTVIVSFTDSGNHWARGAEENCGNCLPPTDPSRLAEGTDQAGSHRCRRASDRRGARRPGQHPGDH
jgi:hypothetical protein